MSYKINYFNKKVLITYGNKVQRNEMQNAFFEVTEFADFKRLEFIIHDFTKVESYSMPPIPANIIDKVQAFTQFASSWNQTVKIVAIATHEEIRTLFSEIIKKNTEKLIWEHLLFENWEQTQKWNPKLFNIKPKVTY